MNNQDIRDIIKKSNIKYWELACEIGISDSTLTRWLRKPLNKYQRESIINAIELLKSKNQKEG